MRDLLTARAEYAICDRYTAPVQQLAWNTEQLEVELSFGAAVLGSYNPRCDFAEKLAVLLEILWGAGRFDEARHAAEEASPYLDDEDGAAALRRAERSVARHRRARRARGV